MNDYENYDATVLPLSNEPGLRLVQEKILNNIPLSVKEKRHPRLQQYSWLMEYPLVIYFNSSVIFSIVHTSKKS